MPVAVNEVIKLGIVKGRVEMGVQVEGEGT